MRSTFSKERLSGPLEVSMSDLLPEEPCNSVEETGKGMYHVRIIQINLSLIYFSDGCIIPKNVHLFIYLFIFMNKCTFILIKKIYML